MKKTTLYLTLGALLTPLYSQANNLSIYGLAHLSVDNVDDGQESSYYLASNSSRLGFSGDYLLSNGLTVFFNMKRVLI